MPAASGPSAVAIGPVQAAIAVASNADETGIAQDAEVLGDRAEREVEARGDVARGEFVVPDEAEDLASARFADDLQAVHRPILADVEIDASDWYCSRD